MTTPLPEDIVDMAEMVYLAAKGALNECGFIEPMWFVIQREGGVMIPVYIPIDNDRDHAKASDMVRAIVKKLKMDCVIFACEADMVVRTSLDNTENVRPSQEPDKKSVIQFMVETHEGMWVASPEVTDYETKRHLAPLEFAKMTAASPNHISYLSPSPTTKVH